LIKQKGGKNVYKLIIAGIGVLAAALLAGGCGGDGSGEATAQVSKAEFFNQARAICAGTQKEIEAQLLLASKKSSQKDFSSLYRKIAQLRRREAEELDSISGSGRVEEEVEPLIADVLEVSDLLAQGGRAVADDPSLREYREGAEELHLSKC
jgi:hypothetical protein